MISRIPCQLSTVNWLTSWTYVSHALASAAAWMPLRGLFIGWVIIKVALLFPVLFPHLCKYNRRRRHTHTHTPDHRIRFLIKHHLHGRTAAYRCDWGVDYCGFARLSHALNPRWMYPTYTRVHTAHTHTSTLNHTLTVFALSSTRYKTSLTGSSLVG